MTNTVEMANTIRDIINRNGLDGYRQRLDEIIDGEGIKIGFLGTFSSGKTSLINSVLEDLNLPIDPAPTTKSICIIVPKEGVDSNRYFCDNGETLDPISVLDFNDIVDGTKNATAVIETRPSDILPLGTVFVDTPGFDSIGTEVDLTAAYLCKMDAGVICHKGTMGTIPQNLIDFLLRPDIKKIANHLVFVVTYLDKMQKSLENVRRELIEQISSIKGLSIDHVEDKFLFVDAKHNKNTIEFYEFLQKHILKDKEDLRNKRIAENLNIFAAQIRDVLQERLDNMQLDDSGIESKRECVKKELVQIEKTIEEETDRLRSFSKELETDIKKQMNMFESAITSAEGPALQQNIDSMLNAVQLCVQNKVNLLLPNFTIPSGIVVAPSLASSLNRIDKVKDVGVTIATTAVTAWILPGAGVAANAAEGSAGAAVKVGAANAAKGAAVTAAEKSVGTKIIGALGTIIRDINPLEHVGSFVASQVKGSSFNSYVNNTAVCMANNVINSLKQVYTKEILEPIWANKKNSLLSLDDLTNKRQRQYDSFKEDCERLEEDINILWKVNA